MSTSSVEVAKTPVPAWLLRMVAATAAGAGLLLHLLNLAFLLWVWAVVGPETVDADPRRLLPRTLIIMTWGVGFSVLALVIVARIGHRYEVLMAALFLAFYTLWVGVVQIQFADTSGWLFAAWIILDALTHATGVRFTQLFPRPLRPTDLTSLGPRWLGRTVMKGFAALLDARVFWIVVIVIEGGRRLLPAEPALAHVLLWVLMAAVYLYASYRRGGEEDRQRVFWVLEGVMVFVAGQIVMLGLWAVEHAGLVAIDRGIWTSWVTATTALATLVCFYLAVFSSGALDSALVLRRTTVLSATSVLAIVIFLTLEAATEQILSDLLGLDSGLGGLLSGVVAGLTFHPLSVWIDRRIRGRATV